MAAALIFEEADKFRVIEYEEERIYLHNFAVTTLTWETHRVKDILLRGIGYSYIDFILFVLSSHAHNSSGSVLDSGSHQRLTSWNRFWYRALVCCLFADCCMMCSLQVKIPNLDPCI